MPARWCVQYMPTRDAAAAPSHKAPSDQIHRSHWDVMLSCANSQGKGSDTAPAKGVPPISKKVGIQSTSADHPNNPDTNAKRRFECGKWIFQRLRCHEQLEACTGCALQRMSWHYNACSDQWFSVCGMVIFILSKHTAHGGCISSPQLVVLVSQTVHGSEQSEAQRACSIIQQQITKT